jgi:hypothetical protein
MKGSIALKITVLILIVTLLSACSGSTPGPTATPAPGATNPVDAIKGFFTAVYTSQDPAPYVCATPGVADAFEVAARISMAATQGATVDPSGLTFTVKDQSADKATVSVAGQISYTMLNNQTSAPFPTSDVSAVNENGSWKFCGGV